MSSCLFCASEVPDDHDREACRLRLREAYNENYWATDAAWRARYELWVRETFPRHRQVEGLKQ